MTSFAARSTLPAVGLSVGSSTVAAVSAARAVTGRPVINRAGQPIEDFVDRVGDPVGIVAADGSLHSGADLLAEVLLALARRSTAGSPLPPTVAVAGVAAKPLMVWTALLTVTLTLPASVS